MNGFLTLTWTNIRSAVVYGLLTMAVTFFASVVNAIIANDSIYGLNWASIIDESALAALGVLVTIVSLIKNLLTDEKGRFLGVTEVIPDKE